MIRFPAPSWDKKAHWLCRLFGHKSEGWKGSIPYGQARYRTTDGIGTHHCEVSRRCDRCHQNAVVINFHLPSNWKIIEKGTPE